MNQQIPLACMKVLLAISLFVAWSATAAAWPDGGSQVVPLQPGQPGAEVLVPRPWPSAQPMILDPWTARALSVGTTPGVWSQREVAAYPIGIQWTPIVSASGVRPLDAGAFSMLGVHASVPDVSNGVSSVPGNRYGVRPRSYSDPYAIPYGVRSSYRPSYVTSYPASEALSTTPSVLYPTFPSAFSGDAT